MPLQHRLQIRIVVGRGVHDETVDAYEVGLKSSLFDGLLTANLAAFTYDYQDLQVYTLVVDPLTRR